MSIQVPSFINLTLLNPLSLSLHYLSIPVSLFLSPSFSFLQSLFQWKVQRLAVTSISPVSNSLCDSWLHAYLKHVWTEWLSISLSPTYKTQQHHTHTRTHHFFAYSTTNSLSNSFQSAARNLIHDPQTARVVFNPAISLQYGWNVDITKRTGFPDLKYTCTVSEPQVKF